MILIVIIWSVMPDRVENSVDSYWNEQENRGRLPSVGLASYRRETAV